MVVTLKLSREHYFDAHIKGVGFDDRAVHSNYDIVDFYDGGGGSGGWVWEVASS